MLYRKWKWQDISVWHIPLLCVQWKTADDGQRNCPKHVEFYSKNKFEKLVHLVGFSIRNFHDARSPERQKSPSKVIKYRHLILEPETQQRQEIWPMSHITLDLILRKERKKVVESRLHSFLISTPDRWDFGSSSEKSLSLHRAFCSLCNDTHTHTRKLLFILVINQLNAQFLLL